jgi:hypothetical protein
MHGTRYTVDSRATNPFACILSLHNALSCTKHINMKEVPVSARDIIRLEEALSNAAAEFISLWTKSCNARLGLTSSQA